MRTIDADELLKRVDQSWQNAGLHGVDYHKFKYWVRFMPTIEAEPKHGRWIPVTKGAIKEIYICSRCHRKIEDDGIPALIPIRYPYCHCGAKMDEVEE